MEDNLLPAIVIDNGSSQFKAGIAVENKPRCCFSAVIGESKRKGVIVGQQGKMKYIGNEAQEMRGVLNLTYPMQNGLISNFESMEGIWRHFYEEEIRIDPKEHPVLITETPLNPKENREEMAQIMFETFNVPKFYTAIPALLSFYASGRTTGIVVDSGDGVSHTVPIYEGHSIPHAIQKIDLAGRTCTEWLIKILNELGISFPSSAEREIANDIKEKYCYVAPDYEKELGKYKGSADNHKPYELPDGDVISIKDQRFRCPELLFKPQLFGLKMRGIHELTFQSIKKCDIDTRRTFFENIVLSGGTTLFEGIVERLGREVSSLAPKMKINIIAADDRKYSAWIGGSIIAKLDSFKDQWITREQYDEHGVSIVHKKCLLYD